MSAADVREGPRTFTMYRRGDLSATHNASQANPPGARFAKLADALAQKPGVTNPAGLAASIGRRKLGAAKFNALAAAGRKRKRP